MISSNKGVEPQKRANHKKDRIRYGRRFPAACCRDLQKRRLRPWSYVARLL